MSLAGEENGGKQIGPLPEREPDGEEVLCALGPRAVRAEAKQDAAEDAAAEAQDVEGNGDEKAEKQATDAPMKAGLRGHPRSLRDLSMRPSAAT